MSNGLLLDTCAVIWMTHKEFVAPEARDAVNDCQTMGIPVFVSAATAWEMAMLVSRGRIRETQDAKRWYDGFRQEAAIDEQPVTADTFIASCFLPQPIHKDPIDRILIATARSYDLTIVTRDRAILSYGAAGHVKVLAC